MTECNGCGACCQPVILPYSPADIAIHGHTLDAETVAFYHEHLTPMRRAEGRAIVGSWSSGYSEIFDGERWVLLAAFYYECDRYDPVSKQCGDYENRPSMCRDYPWYGDLPDRNKLLPPTCSYRADVGRPVEPVPVELGPRPKAARPR